MPPQEKTTDRAETNDINPTVTRLRDHPLMTKRGIRSWPPVWIEKYGAKELTGEIGRLTYVGTNARRFPEAIFLHMVYEGTPYYGSLLTEDYAFRWALYELLQNNIGRTIKEIGELDLSYLL
jgi:hypothetical protein